MAAMRTVRAAGFTLFMIAMIVLGVSGGLVISTAAQAQELRTNYNLARGDGATASQSSTLGTSYASLAIDGNRSGRFADSSVSHTALGTEDPNGAWWEVDLGDLKHIDTVRLFNRTDTCCAARATVFFVFVSTVPITDNTVLGATRQTEQTGGKVLVEEGQMGRPSEYNVGIRGRYVRVQLASTDDTLNLAEVEVIGDDLDMAPTIESVKRLNDLEQRASGNIGLTWRITFSEAVTNVDRDDFAVRGHSTVGPVSVAPVAGQMGTYDVTAEPQFAGAQNAELTLTLAADNNIADTAGKPLQGGFPAGAETRYIIDDDIPPQPMISGHPAVTNETPFNITVTFLEPVAYANLARLDGGTLVTEFAVTNGSAMFLNPPARGTFATEYTVQITPNGNGDVTINVGGAGLARDAAGNTISAGQPVTVAFDDTPPQPMISGHPTVTNETPFNITVTFLEPVAYANLARLDGGTLVTEFAVTNGSAMFLNPPALGTFATEYTVQITPNGNGDVTINVGGAGLARDAAGNTISAGQPVTVAFDDTPPAAHDQRSSYCHQRNAVQYHGHFFGARRLR